MAENVNTRINAMGIGQMSKNELRQLVSALVDVMIVFAQKLDTDAGVTATDFKQSLDRLIEKE